MKVAASFVLLASICAISSADTSLKTRVDKMIAESTKAIANKDVIAFEKSVGDVDPKFVYTEDGGKPIDYKTTVAQMKQSFAMVKKTLKASAKVISLKEKGDTGVATAKHTMIQQISFDGKKTQVLAFEGVSTNTFVKKGGKWVFVSMNMKTSSMTLDGKPMNMGQPKAN